MVAMIEIAGPQKLLTFDGRVIELFSGQTSRRIHVRQIIGAELSPDALLVDEGVALELSLLDGRRLRVPFAARRRSELERLVVELLPCVSSDVIPIP
jgi:hypothetical protein